MEENRLMDLMETAERLEAVAAALEESAAKLAEKAVATEQGSLGPIVATAATERELELERKLAAAEERTRQLELQAAAATTATLPATVSAGSGRRTLSAGTTALLAKQGVSVEAGSADGDGTVLHAAALDAALASLSIEQRFAVKAELLRSGALAQ